MTSFYSESGKISVPASGRVNAITFRAGDVSALVVQAYKSNFELMFDTSTHGLYLGEGCSISLNDDDMKKIPPDTQMRLDVVNLDTINDGTVAYFLMGTK